ncbi:MAG: N-formylglutamate amidohydrolase, partial [Woeseia sp.]
AIPLLAPGEPHPYRILNENAVSPILLLCDHASRYIPPSLNNLGLDPVALRSHLAWDIGAAATTEYLADALGATAVLAGYSRLVVDCNRKLLDAQAFLEFGDGVVINGNRGLSEAARQARASEIYWPYHGAIGQQLDRLRNEGCLPIILAMHSFTPVMDSVPRPWEIGILWDKDPRVPDILIAELRRAGINVGDNEPYSGRGPQDFTIDYHAESRGLPHAGVEIRQDLIHDQNGVERIAGLLQGLLENLPDQIEINGTPAATI